MSSTDPNQPGCASSNCGCGPNIDRRELLRIAGASSLALLAGKLPVMAGPFEASEFQNLVPVDKKLDAKWVESLFARGSRTVYRGDDLKYIGMPVGGLCCGQLYLGGDGKLWHWDIFNERFESESEHYAEPLAAKSAVDQGFSVRVGQRVWTLDAKGFPEVAFCGEYPIGYVEYTNAECPLAISLEAFSPFIPLNVDDSSLPATVFHFTLTNNSAESVEAELAGWLENKVCFRSGNSLTGMRVNRVVRGPGLTLLECSARGLADEVAAEPRAPILFADFEGETFAPWNPSGTAFGNAPTHGAPAPEQKLTGFTGQALANSWAKSDQPTGALTSPEFKVERRYVNFLIGGGNHPGETCANLLVGDKVVRTETGANSDALAWRTWNVSDLVGQTARLEMVDRHTGGWGHIDVDQIEFADTPRAISGKLEEQADFGTMTLALLGDGTTETELAEQPFRNKLVGSLAQQLSLKPGESQKVAFVITWHFSNLNFAFTPRATVPPTPQNPVEKGRYYAAKFASAGAVARHVAANYERLYGQTKLWHDTWYDSMLPYWFLDRTFLNASTLATSTAYRFANGRFYGWEGVGCCAGTCTHVWHYEQAMGRLFPELDILLRESVDFNPEVAFNAQTGVIGHRGEVARSEAVDGQAGTILRAYRDHLVSPDDSFLKRNWPQIKQATQWLMSLDSNQDGILDQPQFNTLDGTWYGKIPWITGLALAATKAAEHMAIALRDAKFAETCQSFCQRGRANFVGTFWNGEYFQQIHDPTKLEHVGSYNGCEIDQILGQGWAFQTGLERVLPEQETRAALRSIWKYNFAPDVGPFRNHYPAGRWYALAGEAGTLMCSWPRGDKLRVPKGFDFYFNECMNGFEHQVAGHMLWEGMLLEGLAIERAIHDRYHPSKRNPWNEVECGDHYARSMASYGVFLAACGFSYNGPEQHLGFAPRIKPEDFRAAFTVAEGWGTYSQQQSGQNLTANIALKWGQLRLSTLSVTRTNGAAATNVSVKLAGQQLPVTFEQAPDTTVVKITLPAATLITTGQSLEVIVFG